MERSAGYDRELHLPVTASRQISLNQGNTKNVSLPQRSSSASKSPSVTTSHPIGADDVRGNASSCVTPKDGGNKDRENRRGYREKLQDRGSTCVNTKSNSVTAHAHRQWNVANHRRENRHVDPQAKEDAITIKKQFTNKKYPYRARSPRESPQRQTTDKKTAVIEKSVVSDITKEDLIREDPSNTSTVSQEALASPARVPEQKRAVCAIPAGVPGEIFEQKLDDVRVSDGESVTLTAGVREGIKVQKVLWLRNNQELADCPNFRHVTSGDERSFSLVIADVFPEDAGEYACVITSNGHQFRTKCTLHVKDKIDDNDILSTDNHSLDAKQRLSDKGAPQSHIKRSGLLDIIEEDGQDCPHEKEPVVGIPSREDNVQNGDQISGDKFNDHTDEGLPDLLDLDKAADSAEFAVSSDAHEDDVARYARRGATASTSPPTVAHRRYTPAQILKGPQSLAVLRGENITLRTHFIGTGPVKITWIKGGKILSSGDRVSISVEEGMSLLAIRDVMADDSGKYVVSVENEGGSDCHFASVAVEGPPYPPTGQPTISDVTTHSLIVSWYGSAYDGGSVITGYIVEMCVLPDNKWTRISASCHSTSYHVRDLLPNRQYVFRVRAENVHGVSDPGMESEPILLMDDAEEEKELEDFAPFEHRVVELDDTANFEDYYNLNEEVGKGRFGVVYKCTELSTGEERAAKVIRCVKSRDKQKVRDEIAIMNRLRHPKLLQLAAAFEKPREIVLVTEFVSGGELFERVIADDFVLTERDCILFMRQICEGVRYMHSNYVIHLDLKPENILCKTQTSHQIKIIDFGLARIYNPAEKLHVLFGTPEFVAPEVISYEPVSLASDMWSLGVICYVLLSGLSPFMGDTDTETFSNITRAEFDFDDEAFDEISDDAKEFISLLLLKIPEKRMTAEECLKHKWLAQERHKMKGIQLSKDKLKKFIIRRKWQKTGNAIRALGRIQSLSGYSSGRSTLGSYSSYSSMTSDNSDASSGATNNSSNFGPKHPHDVIKEHEEDAYFSGESSHGDMEDGKADSSRVITTSDRKSLHSYKKSHADSDYASVEAPSFVKALSKLQHVLTGQSVTFEVQVDGGPDPDVIWLKSDIVLESSEKHRISRNPEGVCTLQITDCQEDDEDEYTCVAFNSAGHVSTSIVLQVDPPESAT